MSSSPAQNVSVKQEPSANSSQEQQKKDILVSIILTESTSSLLKLDLPHLEDLDSEESEPQICTIKPDVNIRETNYPRNCVNRKLSEFTSYWFGNKHENLNETDCEKVKSDLAYLRSNSNMKDSLQSVTSSDFTEDQVENNRQANTSAAESSLSLNQKLKPTKVYTRPLFTVHSVAHQNLMKSDANNIYISVLNSHARMTESGWINVCRICHGGESIGDLLSPCHCRGSIALAHLECLERWLKESASSKCELCQHHFQIIRQPKYGVLKSIFVFLRHPGDHLSELLFDLFAFLIYTPSAIASTYMLMLLCESIVKHNINYQRSATAHIMTLAAVFGMAAIDFTYSSWFMVNMQKHINAWRICYRNNCDVKLVLPERKRRKCQQPASSLEDEVD